MALTKALFAGDDPTPESVKRRRAMAAALLAEGSQIKHVDSPLEMIGSLLQSGAGALNNYRADQDEKAGRKTRSDAQIRLAESAFGSGGAGAGFGSATGPIGDSSGASVPAGDRASYIRSGLVSRGLPEHVADGFLVNFKDESGLDPGINEKAPLVAGSRGGFGLYQLTGPRRTAYESFASSRGVDPSDIDTQLDFMVGELGLGNRKDMPGFGSESRAARSILSASDTSSAAQAIVNNFLRPAPEHRASRTRRYAGLQNSAAPVQVASLDPSEGVAAATAPASVRDRVERAVDAQEAVGTVPYTGPALNPPEAVTSIAPVGMPGSSEATNAAIQSFSAANGTTPMQYRGPGQSVAPSAQIDDPGAMQSGVQAAALDPAASQPRTVRQMAEAAVEQQEQAAAPIPTQRPELMVAAPVPQARPSPVNAQGYATELPTPPPPPAQRSDPQQMGQLLLSEQSQGFGTPQSFGQPPYSRELIAQLLGNPWTEDLGQQALQEVLGWRQQNQALALRQQELQQTRAYEDRKAERERAAGNEDYRLRKEIDQQFQKPEGAEWQELPNGDYGYFDPATRRFEKLGSAPKADSGGITIGPDGTVQIGGGPKLPANFMPDPANPGAVKPIPGGPGEQLPAELAGRIAIADSFLGQAPDIRNKLESGAVTGWFDRFQAGNNASSDQAAVFRQMQSGSDALQRLLTGAGMTESEAAIYAQRYLPSYTDDAASAVAKLDQVTREIENARAAALRGRGGTGANVTPNGADTPAGNATDYKTKYGLE